MKKTYKRPRGASRPAHLGQLEHLASVASAASGGTSVAPTPAGEAGDGGDDDAPGYMWGMNIVTGKTRAEEEAEDATNGSVSKAAASRDDDDSERKKQKMVVLRYGSYAGMQLSVAEVRRIKAEECHTLLARRKLVRARSHAVMRARAHAARLHTAR